MKTKARDIIAGWPQPRSMSMVDAKEDLLMTLFFAAHRGWSGDDMDALKNEIFESGRYHAAQQHKSDWFRRRRLPASPR